MLAILGLALLANLNNWRQIKIRYVIQLLLVELLLAWFLLNSSVGAGRPHECLHFHHMTKTST
ncbi:Na+ dependent nucleoside transporter N-terminal domain-containing protein [Shewanella algae]